MYSVCKQNWDRNECMLKAQDPNIFWDILYSAELDFPLLFTSNVDWIEQTQF